jgi:hypothetical protein
MFFIYFYLLTVVDRSSLTMAWVGSREIWIWVFLFKNYVCNLGLTFFVEWLWWLIYQHVEEAFNLFSLINMGICKPKKLTWSLLVLVQHSAFDKVFAECLTNST